MSLEHYDIARLYSVVVHLLEGVILEVFRVSRAILILVPRCIERLMHKV